MGWKNVKEHYRIKHLVQVKGSDICIGTKYISDYIVIAANGVLKKAYDKRFNADFLRYQREMNADLDKLRALVLEPDTFKDSTTVYTYEGRRIVAKQCEVLGWPNLTHDGILMFDHLFSSDRSHIEALIQRRTEKRPPLLLLQGVDLTV